MVVFSEIIGICNIFFFFFKIFEFNFIYIYIVLIGKLQENSFLVYYRYIKFFIFGSYCCDISKGNKK